MSCIHFYTLVLVGRAASWCPLFGGTSRCEVILFMPSPPTPLELYCFFFWCEREVVRFSSRFWVVLLSSFVCGAVFSLPLGDEATLQVDDEWKWKPHIFPFQTNRNTHTMEGPDTTQ